MAAETPPASPLDPALLATFRQQAGPILAAERGLSAGCRVKLASLARQLGMAEERIDGAIRALNESAAPAAPPDPFVEKFRARLRKDLAGKNQAILGPTIETQIVAVACKKFGLPEAIARQIIGEVAAELGLRRISASEAVRNLAAQIDQAAGDATWLAKEVWDRLRVIGGKWGIELEVIDQLIDEKLGDNRLIKMRRRRIAKITLLGVGGAVVAAVVVLLVVAVIRGKSQPPTIGPGSLPGEAGPGVASVPSPPIKTSPDWWDVDLSVAIAGAQTRFSAVRPAYDLVIAESPAERSAGYRKLIELAAVPAPPAGLREAVAEILSGLAALEPDESAASELVAALLALVPAPDAPLPKQRGQYDAAYWAGATAVRMYHRPGLPAERARLIANAVQRGTRVVLADLADRPAREKAVRGGITERFFEQLTVAAPRQPAEVAALFAYVSDLAVDLADEPFARLEATFLAAALPAAGNNWRPFQEAAVRASTSPDSLNVLKMLDAYQRATDPELKQFLAELLVVRSGAKPKSWEPVEVVGAVRKGLGIAGTAALTENDRWQLLKLRAEAALGRSAPARTSDAEWLAQTVELAHLTTLAMALAQGEAGHAVFDAQIETPPQLGASTPDGDKSVPPAPKRMSPPPTPQTLREVERLVDLLAAHARQQPIQRESAIRALAIAADRVPDLSPQQASRVAAYVVAPKEDGENSTVATALGTLRGWHRLRLAVADALPTAKLTSGQRESIVAALAGDEHADPAQSDAQRRAIVRSVLRDLESMAGGTTGEAAGLIFDQAADLLAETYRARGRLLGVAAGEISAAESPSQALQLAIGPLAKSLAPIAEAEDEQYLARLPHELAAWNAMTRDDPRRTVAIQRIFAQLAARRAALLRPAQAALASKISQELAAADLSAATLVAQLHAHEAAVLRLWMLYAPQS
ncbi:MAG: hypothetical protein SFU86_23525 [Pirellulaceae bacterium]|nr:hypothetical protein [Pirellulaceae bacterium]